jgi:hypothetical protein
MWSNSGEGTCCLKYLACLTLDFDTKLTNRSRDSIVEYLTDGFDNLGLHDLAVSVDSEKGRLSVEFLIMARSKTEAHVISMRNVSLACETAIELSAIDGPREPRAQQLLRVPLWRASVRPIAA